MESLVGQHDTVLATKEELSVLVMTKVEHEKEEQQRSKYMETTESNLFIKSEEVDIKLEEIYCESINAIEKEYLRSEIEGDFNGVDNLKQEGTDVDEKQIGLKNEATIEAEQTALSSIPFTLLSSSPEGGHSLVHQSTLETITFETYPQISKCTPNQGKRKSPKKQKSRKALLKCEQCSYEAISISKLHIHMRVHKDPSELDMYECTHCHFRTKYKCSLKSHSILHQDAEGGKRESPKNKKPRKDLLKCEQCSYEAISISKLHIHMSVHKNRSELDMYKCTHCAFKTKYKCSLKSHSILHQDAPYILSHKCNSCDFESRRKDTLRIHIRRVHQKVSGMYIQEPGVLKCDKCLYMCSRPSWLMRHMLIHKDPSELDMYKCPHCDFKTKYKYRHKSHSILHKDAADMPRYKCNSCDFESKRIGSLATHICLHQKVSGIQKPRAFKCEQCSYACNGPNRFLLHMRVHKDRSELNMYECSQCNFKTKHKNSLKGHFIIHKKATDIPRFKCNSCDFETSRKHSLIRHIKGRHNTFSPNSLEKHKPCNKKNAETASKAISKLREKVAKKNI